jgi:hypothetical protein
MMYLKNKYENGVKVSRVYRFKNSTVIVNTKGMLFNYLTVSRRGRYLLVFNQTTKKYLRPVSPDYYKKSSKTYKLVYNQ